jgi:hypothetical protein
MSAPTVRDFRFVPKYGMKSDDDDSQLQLNPFHGDY